jgi:flagella basal body P-ring formation protein FlgA
MMNFVNKTFFGFALAMCTFFAYGQSSRLVKVVELSESLRQIASQRFVQQQAIRSGMASLILGDGLVTFANQPPERNLRVKFEFEGIDQAIVSSPCASVEANFPDDVEIWGKSIISIRCLDASSWTASIPLTVKVFCYTFIAALDLGADRPLRGEDFRLGVVELSKQSSAILFDKKELLGRRLMQKISAGTALRMEHLVTGATASRAQ